jgi:O-antigen biosynthesis protein
MLSSWLRGVSGAWSYLRLRVTRSGGLFGITRVIWRNFRLMGWGYLRGAVVRALFELRRHAKTRGRGLASNDYAVWRAQGHMWGAPRWQQGDAPGPLISVVMPVYRPDLEHFRAAVASIQAQDYPNWQLCMADDASGQEPLRALLLQMAASDDRIRVCLREENGHISACSNSALELASGEYVLLFDQDDLLPPHALGVVAKAVVTNPQAAIIYSDEDKVDEAGTLHFDPYFKPDFDLELFMGQNLVSHLGVYSRALVSAVGGFRVGLEGSQDYDLALRVLELAGPGRVLHVPEVLYHWRASRGSTALANSEKSYASVAARRAVSEHLRRTGSQAVVEPVPGIPFFNRLDCPAPDRSTSLTFVFLLPDAVGTREAERTVLQALAGASGFQWRADFLTAPAARADAGALSRQVDARFGGGRFRVVRADDEPGRKAFLAGLSGSPSDLVCVISVPLSGCPAGWVAQLASIALQPRFAGVAPRLLDPFGFQCHGGVVLPDDDHARHAFSGMPAGANPQGRSSALAQAFTTLSPAVFMARSRLWSEFSMAGPLDCSWSMLAMMLQWRQLGQINHWTPSVTLNVGWQVARDTGNLLDQLDEVQRHAWRQCCLPCLPDAGYNPNLSREGDFLLEVRGERP